MARGIVDLFLAQTSKVPPEIPLQKEYLSLYFKIRSRKLLKKELLKKVSQMIVGEWQKKEYIHVNKNI